MPSKPPAWPLSFAEASRAKDESARSSGPQRRHPMLWRFSVTKLKRSEELLPRRCSQRLCGGMSVRANDHCSFLDLLEANAGF
jgi:hypothetical protein